MNHMPIKLTNEILSAAIEGFEAQKARIDARILEIRSRLGGKPADLDPSQTDPPKRKVSAAARRRMAKAQKLRWKKIKQGPAQPAAEAKKAGPRPATVKKIKGSTTGKTTRKVAARAKKSTTLPEKATAQAANQ
jgi:hypothetical protein